MGHCPRCFGRNLFTLLQDVEENRKFFLPQPWHFGIKSLAFPGSSPQRAGLCCLSAVEKDFFPFVQEKVYEFGSR